MGFMLEWVNLMKRGSAALFACVVFGLCLAAPSSLLAQGQFDPDESDQSESSTSDDPMHFSLRLGVKGGLMVQGAEEVPETVDYRANGMTYNYEDTNIFGSVGVGGGGGAVAEIRFGQIVGLETGFYVTADNAKGENEVTEAGSGQQVGTATQYQKTTAFHVPLLVKFSLTKKDIRPVFGLGLEFVIQQNSSLTYENDEAVQDPSDPNRPLPSERNEIEPSNYTMFMFTGGVEFDVGPVTIPVELRVGYNLGWDNTFTERVRVENPGTNDETFFYDGKYLGHAGIFTGVQYRWDFGGSSDTSE
jgi:hypothetical protein